MPVSCYPGSLFLVFFLLVGVLWDTPGTGVSSSQWSTSPVCLFFYSFSSLVTASLPVWEGWGPYLPRLGGNKGVLSSSRSSVLTSSPCRGGIHPWLPTDPHKSPGSPENSHAESSAAAGPCPGLSSLLGSGSLPDGGKRHLYGLLCLWCQAADRPGSEGVHASAGTFERGEKVSKACLLVWPGLFWGSRTKAEG